MKGQQVPGVEGLASTVEANVPRLWDRPAMSRRDGVADGPVARRELGDPATLSLTKVPLVEPRSSTAPPVDQADHGVRP